KPHERAHREFDYIPYLNSSLFEPHVFEQKFLTIATLQDDCDMPYYSKTVLKDAHNKQKNGNVNMLHYFFEFLDAYDFSSEGSEELVTESKSLINASVLGLIFEKLNGYKDGSFYTPSFITMYMSKETITKAIVEKFNQTKGWNCESLDALDDKIEDKKEANAIIDSLSICDPAVGSGHFLVSSLNTILETKSKLRILFDADGKRIKDYELSVENDELIVRDDEGEIFEYKRKSKEATRIQKMLFTEKQKIIENSLFGVDINPNSAQITRLRLWIELLKNSYYDESNQLVTMPNIDINIKVGNSLISRYGLEDEIDIPNIKHAIERYKASVKDYKEGNFLSTKEDIRSAIEDVKGMFGLTLKAQWKQTETYKRELGRYVKEYGMDGLKRDMQLDALEFNYGYHGNLFEEELTATKKKEKAKLLEKVTKAKQAIEEIEKGKVYENSFEWRFEFPEVLDDEGNFVGFDVVIGNPPYIPLNKLKGIDYNQFDYRVFDKSGDILSLFFEKGICILNQYASLSLITSNSWLKTKYGEALKDLFSASGASVQIINFEDTQIFEEATVETCIVTIDRSKPAKMETVNIKKFDAKSATVETLKEAITAFASSGEDDARLMRKIEERGKQLKEWDISINYGIKTGFNKAFIIGTETRNRLIVEDPKSEALLKPMVRGRDVQKYAIEWADMWLINAHNNPPVEIDEYPAIKEYLDQFYPQIEKRYDQGKTPYNLRNCAYLKDFDKPKIVWGEISDAPKFAYDESGIYVEATSFIMTGESLKYLLAVLNSNLSKWYFEHISTTTGMGTNRWKKFKLELLPIAECEDEQPFTDLVDQIIEHKKQNQDTAGLEAQIDRMVYDLYGLTEEEI
ncbi:TaqI-like C-terminal specificity domain-containing protein, partial [Sulfurovum sp.]